MSIAWFLPTQANTFFKENVTPKLLILSFALAPCLHLLTLPLTSLIHYKFSARLSIFLGLIILPFAMLWIGKVTFTGTPAALQKPQTTAVGLLLLGVASGLI